jgi:hypothetical protein
LRQGLPSAGGESSFDERWNAGRPPEPSFAEYWDAIDFPGGISAEPDEHPKPQIDLRPRTAARPAAGKPAPPPADVAKKSTRTAEAVAEPNSPSDADETAHTAIYDIAAHVVYLPDGTRLEAHSGLGQLLDDPRYVNVKHRGATPPNVYDLAMREDSFHGVRAIRLNPEDNSKMFGRDGMLAHPYMLGPNGQSNGCVSIGDYQAFLNAYLSGEVTRLVVVEHLGAPPPVRTASGWIAETLKALFVRS